MDPVTAMAIYGGGSAINALGSYFGGKSQAAAMEEVNKQNADLTRAAWARDDNAVYRRTQDLLGSGLNPALAAGSAASTSSPIPQQAAPDMSWSEGMKSAGQSIASAPTFENEFKRSQAATKVAQAAARATLAEARIKEHDATEIEEGRDPRNKGTIDQIVSGIPKIVKMVSEASKKYGTTIKDAVGYSNDQEIERANALADEALRRQRAMIKSGRVNPAEKAKIDRMFQEADAIKARGFKKQ